MFVWCFDFIGLCIVLENGGKVFSNGKLLEIKNVCCLF